MMFAPQVPFHRSYARSSGERPYALTTLVSRSYCDSVGGARMCSSPLASRSTPWRRWRLERRREYPSVAWSASHIPENRAQYAP
jgi:hypothetical protein